MSKATVAGNEPIAVQVESGKKYWWCSCGKSQSQPFCDGSHKGTDFSPILYTAKEDSTVWFCTCKQSNTKPSCDGSHSKL